MQHLTSVITLTHNKLPVTRTCLPTHFDGRDAPWELIVVDNGSDDGTRDWLERFRADAAARGVAVTLIFNDGNIGCSTARNQGLAAARGERVAFVDNDVALRSRGWLSRLNAALDADPEVALVGPKLVYPFAPHDIQCAGVAISPTGRPLFMGRGEQRDDPRYGARRDVQCLISACIVGRRDALERVGGFDEAFNPVEFEDFDLCYRLRDAGFRLLYEPGVELYHYESVTTAGTPALPNTYLIVRNGLLFKRRWRHWFENENGPPDSETRWRRVAAPAFEAIPAPPRTP